MVSAQSVEKQLKDLGFNYRGWGRTEVKELQHIILPDEEIFECVNGIYEGGFALLLGTDVRVLLVDKKPLNYLTVEDLRFDMINEIDYSHRLFGAYIKISAGETSLKFTSINQARLRKLIGHVQFCMAEAKKKQATHPHLEQINQQLQSYLLEQHKQQQELNIQLQKVRANQESVASLPKQIEPIRPSPALSDYLFAQSLLAQHQAQTAELYSEGRQEIFNKHGQQPAIATISKTLPQHVRHLAAHTLNSALSNVAHPLEIDHPLHIAYSKLPTALRNRKFGYPSLRANQAGSQEAVSAPAEA